MRLIKLFAEFKTCLDCGELCSQNILDNVL